jgi:hypothetical protein
MASKKKAIHMKIKTMSNRYLVLAGGLLLSAAFSLNSCKKNSTPSPHVNPINPDSAAGNATLYVTGSGLSDITSIMFTTDSVPAPFNTNFNTDGAIIFRVPDTAFGGPQTIVFTNKWGQHFSTSFNVLAFPSVSAVSNQDFNPGDTITLTGNNLEGLTAVTILGSSTTIPIVSNSHKTAQIVMPTTTLSRFKVSLTNATGTDTLNDFEFLSIANAFVIFANGNYGANVSSGAWGPSAVAAAPTPLYKNDPSFSATYGKGDWWANGFAYWNPPYFPTDASYTYLTFWIYGGIEDYTLYVTGSAKAGGGYGNADVTTPIDVPPHTWTFFKLNISSIGLFGNSSNFQQLGWWVKGPNDQDETMYFDDVMFVK